MSNPNPNPNQNRRRAIRGPQSALTDFLSSHNISAHQIQSDAQARRAAALASQQAAAAQAAVNTPAAPANGDGDSAMPDASGGAGDESEVETKESKKRKRDEAKAISKIKASKRFQANRARRQQRMGSEEEITDSDEEARQVLEADASYLPMPKQMENCEICDTRFAVTAYSRKGPEGGLLCNKCSKDLDDEEGKGSKKKKADGRGNRRQTQSKMMDGQSVKPGAKSLMDLCIEALVKNIDMASDLGELPYHNIEKIAAQLSKKRLLTSKTLDLFLKSHHDTVSVYDGAKLVSDDYIRIFQLVPHIKKLRLRNGIQFKNKVMEFLTNCPVELESLAVHGANLIDDDHWNNFLVEKGKHLKALKVYATDGHFGDEQIDLISATCPNIERLKISHNQKVTDAGIAHVAKLPTLQHLTLRIYKETTTDPYLEVIKSIGIGLKTLCLDMVPHLEDPILDTMHKECAYLQKFRLTDNECITDAAFVRLFTNWQNPPLKHIDLHKCRHLDAGDPSGNAPGIGLCSAGFTAMMEHSGSTLVYLNIHSCRHITSETFEEVFKKGKCYPELQTMDASFIWGVNDFVVGCIFRACPKLQTLKVFGNFGVTQKVEPYVPEGRLLLGVPTALGIEMRGARRD